MSTLSGLASKGEKGKSKFQSLDINSLYRGESLEPAQKTILRKHGMQSLGRVPTARRAPINLPSLKAETSGADPPVSLVPSGGTGWGSKPSGEGGNATASPVVTQGSVAAAPLLPSAAATPSNTTQPPSQSRQATGPVGNTNAPEFPKLSGGLDVDGSLTNTNSGGSVVVGASHLSNAKGGSTSGVDVQYGPGPSLRPQSMVGDAARAGALGAGGPSTTLAQTQVVAGGSGPPTGATPTGPSGGVGVAAGGNTSTTTPFSGIMPRFMYRGGFPGPGGFPTNFQPPLHGTSQRPQRVGYPIASSGGIEGEGGPTNRFGGGVGGRLPGPLNIGQGGSQATEDEVYQRPIIKEEDLNKMDDIVRGNGWATQDDIDYNQKLSFSDDESTEDDSAAAQLVRKDTGISSASSSSSQAPQQGNRSVCQTISQLNSMSSLTQSQNTTLHMNLKGKDSEGRRSTIGRSPEDERDGLVDFDHRDDRGRGEERNRDTKRLDGNRLIDSRVGWGQTGSRSSAPPPLMPPPLMDYRGGSRSSSGVSVSQQGSSAAPASLANVMPGPFKMSSHMPYASGRLLDDDEVWLEKRRQTTEEVAIAVVRAKQRKEEEEKKFEESKQAAAKKLQNLEEKMGVNKAKKDGQQQHIDEGSPEWDRSRLSSDDKVSVREIPRDSPADFRAAPSLMGGSGLTRERDRELRAERERDRHDHKFSRAFQSNLPPRFQRQQQQAEQQHLPILRGPPSPPLRPNPTSGSSPPEGGQPSPSPPSVTSSEPSTPAEGRGTHESRWGSLGSSQPHMHYPAQGIGGIKSGSSTGRRCIRDEGSVGGEREAERDREDRGRGNPTETTRANSNPAEIREKERPSEPKRVISSSEERDRRIDDRFRHDRNIRGSGPQGGYVENGRRAYYDGSDFGRGYNRPSQEFEFDRLRSDRDHSGDTDQSRFSELRHVAASQSRDFDPWDRDREKDGRIIEKEGRDKDRVLERERVCDRPSERMDRERDRVLERGGIADRVVNDRDGRRIVSERDDRLDRIVERERLLERSERDRGNRGGVERQCDRNGERISVNDRERPNERMTDRDRAVDRDRPNERDRVGEKDRVDRPGERSDRQGERSFESDTRSAERERLERSHERGARISNRDWLRERGAVERDGERDIERDRENDRRGLERAQRNSEYRDMRRFDDRRGDALELKKGSSDNYPERRQDSFEPEVDNRQITSEWRESKDWKDDRHAGSLSDERRQGNEDSSPHADCRDDRNDSHRESSLESKLSQLPDLPVEMNGKGPSSNGVRRGEFVSPSSWADSPVENLYADLQEEKKEEYFRNDHRTLIENSSNVELDNEGAWGFPRGGPPSACAQGQSPRGPGAEQSGVAGVAAGAPTTRGPPNCLSPSPPPPTMPSPSGEGPQSPQRPVRALPLASNSSTLQTRQPQRQHTSTTTPITQVVESTWEDDSVPTTDLMLPQEERLPREMLQSGGEGVITTDGKSPVNDKANVDGIEEKEAEHVKEEEKKEEEPLPKRERGGRGRTNHRNRQQNSSVRNGSQWAGAKTGTAHNRGQRTAGLKWTEEEEEENVGELDSEFSAEEEGSGESGKEGKGVRSSSQAVREVENETIGERHTASQDSKRSQGKEGFAPRGEPSRRGRGGGSGFRTRGNIGRRIDRYGPPPSGCPFGQPREEVPAIEAVDELEEEKDKVKCSRHPSGSTIISKETSSSRVGKMTQGSSSIPPRMQRRGDAEKSKKSRGGRGDSLTQRNNDRKHATGSESRQGSSDVAEWETTSENSDAEDSIRERRDGKKGSKGQRGWSGSTDSATTCSSSGGATCATSRAPGAEKKVSSSAQRISPVSRIKGKGKEDSGNNDAPRRPANGAQSRPSQVASVLDINTEKPLEVNEVGAYSTGVTLADGLRIVAEDQGDPPFPFDADTFREVRSRRGGGRIEDSSIRQQQSSQRQRQREGSRVEGRGGKGGGKGQATVGIGRSSGMAPRTGTPSPGPSNSSSVVSIPLRPGSPSSVAGGSFERNRPKLPPRLIKQKETERLQKQQAQQGRSGHLGGSFNNSAYHSHHGASSSHLRNEAGDLNHHHQGKVVVSAGVLFPLKDSNGGPISSGVNAWEKPLGSTTSSTGVGISLGGPTPSGGEERGVDNGVERSGMMSGSGHRDSPNGSEHGNGVVKVQSAQKLAVEKPSSVLLDGTSPPVQTIIFENTNYKSGPPTAASVPKYNHHHHHHSHKMQRTIEKGRGNDRKLPEDNDEGVPIVYGGSKDISKSIDVKADSMQLPLGFTKNAEDSAEMKLDFAFHSEISQLTEEKGHGGGNVKTANNSSSGTLVGSMALQRNMHVGSTAAELNYKIAAVKTFWENTPPMPTVLEISESNDSGSVVASSSVAAATSASPSSSSPSLAPGVSTVTTGFVVEQPSSSVVVVTGEDGSALSATEVVFSPGTPIQGSNSFGVAPSSLGKGDPNATTSNVCKVKPQQQTAVMSTGPSPIGHPGPLSPPPYNSSNAQATAGHINYQPTIGGAAQFGGMSAIPSPPSVIFNSSQQIPAQGGLYGAFPIDGQVLGGGARSQFPQFPSPYGLSQSIGGTSAFSPQSMYLHQPAPHPQPPPPTAAPDMYSSSLSQFRLQAAASIGAPYGGSGHHVGGTTPPQAPMLISTPPASSMTAVKPPSQNQGTGAGGSQQPPSQGAPPGAVGTKGASGHYGGSGALNSAIPSAPSPLYIQYNDQGQAVINHSFLSAGSQMVQRPVQSTVVPPPIQPPTSFYSTSAGRHFTLFAGGQTGFYQPGSSGIGQAQLHQTAAAAAAAVSSAFGLAQGFGPSQSGPVGLQNFGSQLAAQQYRSTYLKSGGGGSGGMPSDHLPTGGRSQLKSPSANPSGQTQGAPDVLSSPFSSAQIPSPKSRKSGNQMQSPTQASAHQKFSSYTPVTALVLQQNSNVRNQMGSGMTGLMRSSGNSAPSRYPSPIQRPVAIAPGGSSSRHRVPQQRANNIGKHYFGHDSKGEDGNDTSKIDGSKAANGRDVPAATSSPSPPNVESGQPSPSKIQASGDSTEGVLEEQVPTTGPE